MAYKLEKKLKGDFDEILEYIEEKVLYYSISARLEEKSDFQGTNSRCSVRIFERYSYASGTRVSLSITLYQSENKQIYLSAITTGASGGVFLKAKKLGERKFLETINDIFDKYEIK